MDGMILSIACLFVATRSSHIMQCHTFYTVEIFDIAEFNCAYLNKILMNDVDCLKTLVYVSFAYLVKIIVFFLVEKVF